MAYTVIVQCLAIELSAFVADDDESALLYAKQNYGQHHDEVLIIKNVDTNRIVTFIEGVEMNFDQALDLINAKAPNTPIREAIVLAAAIAERTTDNYPTASNALTNRATMCRWLDNMRGPFVVQANKIDAIKALRNQFKIGLKEGKDTVDWYLAHPDPMNW